MIHFTTLNIQGYIHTPRPLTQKKREEEKCRQGKRARARAHRQDARAHAGEYPPHPPSEIKYINREARANKQKNKPKIWELAPMLNLTEDQKLELKRRISTGELKPNHKEMRQLYVTRFKDDPFGLFGALFAEHKTSALDGSIIETPPFHIEMMDLYFQHRFIGLAAPRNHAKSTVTTFLYIMYCAIYGVKKNIVIISSTEEMAARFLRRIRDELEENKMLRWAFAPQRTEKWAETEIRMRNGCVIHAKGRGAQLRGLIEGALRPDLVVLDDIEDEEIVRSEMRRMDQESWFNGTVLPTIEPQTGQVIIIGTILHADSLLARIVIQKLYPDFETKVYSALQDDGTTLWPARFPKEELEKTKAAYIARGQLAQFFMEYQNDPIPQENAEFKQDNMSFFQIEELPKNLSVEMFIDLGGGSVKKGADDTAIVVIGMDERNILWVLDYISDKMGTDVPRIAHAIFELETRWKPHTISIEKTQAANFFKSPFEAAMMAEQKYLNVVYINPPKGTGGDRRGAMSDAKYQRIAAMAGPMKFGQIKMQRWMSKMIEQFLTFPRGKHDDAIDALAYAFMFSNKRIRQVKEEEEEDDLLFGKKGPVYEPLYDDIGI